MPKNVIHLIFEERANTAPLIPTAGGVNAPYATGYIVPPPAGTPTYPVPIPPAVRCAARRYFEIGSDESIPGNPNREVNNVLANALPLGTYNFVTASAHEADGRSRLMLVFDKTATPGAFPITAIANNIRVYAFVEANAQAALVGDSLSDSGFVSMEDGVTTLNAFTTSLVGAIPAGAPYAVPTSAVNLPGNELNTGWLPDQWPNPAVGAVPTSAILASIAHRVAGQTRIVVLVAFGPADRVTATNQAPLP